MKNLCPGIRRTVEWLRPHKFETTDSGDGVSNEGMEGALPYPNVFMTAPAFILIRESRRLRVLLEERGIDVAPLRAEDPQPPHIEVSYDPSSNIGIICLFNVDDALLFGSSPASV